MSDARRRLPAVNALLEQAHQAGLGDRASRVDLKDAIRAALDAARAGRGEEPPGGWLAAVERRLDEAARRSLRPVINATGVVLHTNLGRAPLAEVARRAAEAVQGYSTLELDVAAGARGSRQSHVVQLLREVTGGAEALVVNNAASAVFLTLRALAPERETLVSRGELVEIGGSFRIPDILAQSGSILVEVGTTNRTRLDDYRLAVSPRTGLLLKVHRSNFTVTGFVEETPIDALVELGGTLGVAVVHDVGSGLLVRLDAFGLVGEPFVPDSVRAGAVTVFSGDKLLGGPQAGIIVGPAAAIATIAGHPLARALRPDKSILAALEATLTLYRDPDRALREIPVLAMLTVDKTVLAKRARKLARRIPGARTAPGTSVVGGGAFPGAELDTQLVLVPVLSCEAALAQLRHHDPPIIARTHEDHLALDVRTMDDAALSTVAKAAIPLMEHSA